MNKNIGMWSKMILLGFYVVSRFLNIAHAGDTCVTPRYIGKHHVLQDD